MRAASPCARISRRPIALAGGTLSSPASRLRTSCAARARDSSQGPPSTDRRPGGSARARLRSVPTPHGRCSRTSLEALSTARTASVGNTGALESLHTLEQRPRADPRSRTAPLLLPISLSARRTSLAPFSLSSRSTSTAAGSSASAACDNGGPPSALAQPAPVDRTPVARLPPALERVEPHLGLQRCVPVLQA